ncbi:MAG: UDP-N-acetylmuramoyl-tripeptide--D-alanyl-D-alanine ligase [Gammaproteobacteria bacterium]
MIEANNKDMMSLSEAANLLSAELVGENAVFNSVSIDTRTLKKGDLFVALSGPNFDGHDFVAQARNKGAIGLLVSQRVDSTLPQIIVDDTRTAFGQLASAWRDKFDLRVIAVTGSNGKTTVKEMIASILRNQGVVLATAGNLNNDIGVPLTLFRLDSSHQFAVIEMGANNPDEIDYLSRLVRPDVSLITNAAAAHLEGFGDISGVARAKGEIFNGLNRDGCAVLNADDPRVGMWNVMTKNFRQLTFGIRNTANVMAIAPRVNAKYGCSFDLRATDGDVEINLKLPGRHNVMNAVAAAAAALTLGVSLRVIKAGLEQMEAVDGRLQVLQSVDGIQIINDTYNSNPGSMRAALEVLATCGECNEKVLVLGDMGELGNASRSLHEQIGRQAKAVGINYLYAVGDLAYTTAGIFGAGAYHFSSQDELIIALCRKILERGDQGLTLLVKGSRNMRMERVVTTLTHGCLNLFKKSGPEAGGHRVIDQKKASAGGL